MTEKTEQNIKVAIRLLAVIIAQETNGEKIVKLLDDFLEGVRLNWEHELESYALYKSKEASIERCINCDVPTVAHGSECGWQNASLLVMPGSKHVVNFNGKDDNKENWEWLLKTVNALHLSPSRDKEAFEAGREVRVVIKYDKEFHKYQTYEDYLNSNKNRPRLLSQENKEEKMTQLQFHNGTKALMIGVPKDASEPEIKYIESLSPIVLYSLKNCESGAGSFYLPENKGGYELLGFFTPPSELTFNADADWVDDNGMGCYLDYVNQKPDNKYTLRSAQESFISYLLSEIKKADCKDEKFVIIEIK